ncbi:hypothetical protein GQ44DRAFT_749440 [Phaeosphaeriaceae sp. PMI808]|nr:hypothetical protein GQ44DRAFT_749440 [Phaeosphaeriaceae sp. PMI808]
MRQPLQGNRDQLRRFQDQTKALNAYNAYTNHNLFLGLSILSKLLVTALNGLVVGIPAAMIAHSDFIFAAPGTYLLTPFSSLGLVAEGAQATHSAKETLFLSKKITTEQLEHCGFVNRVFTKTGEEFQTAIIDEIQGWVLGHLNNNSILKTKDVLEPRLDAKLSKRVVDELFAGLERQVIGIPQSEFEKIKRGKTKRKL